MYFLLCARFSPSRDARKCRGGIPGVKRSLARYRNAQKEHGQVWVYDLFMRLSYQKGAKKIACQCCFLW